MASRQSKVESLDEEANHVIEEARMVLPGIQALFGFQLIAVFNARFEADLTPWEQWLHFSAIVFTVVSIALIMAPAAYHRQAERGLVSAYFVDLASSLLTWAMTPLLLAITLEIFVISKLIAKDNGVGICTAAIVFALFAWLWFVFPRLRAKRRSVRQKN